MVKRRRGISLMEVVAVAGTITFLASVSYGGLRTIAANTKAEQTKAMLSQMRAAIRLYKYRVGGFPTTLSSYTYYYRGVSSTTGYIYGNSATMPKDPFKGVNTVTYGAGFTGVGGWLYDSATGRVWINLYNWEYGPAGSVQKIPEDPNVW